MALDRKPQVELINVHRVTAEKEVIRYLKNSEHEFVEGLFYTAKRYGQSEFMFNGLQYILRRNRDFSFTVEVSAEQNLTTESLA